MPRGSLGMNKMKVVKKQSQAAADQPPTLERGRKPPPISLTDDRKNLEPAINTVENIAKITKKLRVFQTVEPPGDGRKTVPITRPEPAGEREQDISAINLENAPEVEGSLFETYTAVQTPIKQVTPIYLNAGKNKGVFSSLFAKRSVGLDIGSHSVKCVQLEKYKAGFKLISLAVVEIISADPGISDYEEAKKAGIQKAMAGIKQKKVRLVSAMGGPEITIHRLHLPEMNKQELISAMGYQAKKYSPYEAKGIEFAYQLLKHDKEKSVMEVLLVTAPKDLLSKHTKLTSRLNMTPDIIDIEPLALMNLVVQDLAPADDEAVALLNLGDQTSFIDIYNPLNEIFLHYSPIAGKDFTKGIQLKFHIGPSEAEAKKKSGAEIIASIQPELNKLLYDIRRTLTFYKNQTSIRKFNQLVLSGGNANISSLTQYLASELDLPVTILNPFHGLIFDKEVFKDDILSNLSGQLALAVSLAKRGETP